MKLALPEPIVRDRLYGPVQTRLRLMCRVVTPLLGGAARMRSSDDHDPIRAPSIAGQLRFWWRALFAAGLTPEELARREGALFGSTSGEGQASAVRLTVRVIEAGKVDGSDIVLGAPSTVALFSARGTAAGEPTAPRRLDVAFELVVDVPEAWLAEVHEALRAWLWFGGVGGRTRRGAGSLTVTAGAAEWLPASPESAAEMIRKLGPALTPTSTPSLRGAWLLVDKPADATKAWERALGTWRELRQGVGSGARDPAPAGCNPKRAGRSNWPEADKVRRVHMRSGGRVRPHAPRYNAEPAWPRAQLGLPIVGQFQVQPRPERPGPRYEEPHNFELIWQQGGELRERLASPAIVKALPLANGSFVPMILWLHRALPDGAVGLKPRRGGKEVEAPAPFTRLIAPGDTDRTGLLAGKADLRQAVCDWATQKQGYRRLV